MKKKNSCLKKIKKILIIFGTRPEAIKLCPLVIELNHCQENIRTVVCVTAQHREMLEQLRPLQNATFCPISVSGSIFNPRNILYIPVVKNFAFLELEQKLTFFKGLQLLTDFGVVQRS